MIASHGKGYLQNNKNFTGKTLVSQCMFSF